MTANHVKPLLENSSDAESLCQVAKLLARGHIPHEVLTVIRMGRLRALQGGVRGIVAGDILRRLVARTVARQIRQKVERATALFQHALATRAGCECIAHALQALTDQDPQSTILSRWIRRVRHHFSKCNVARIETHGWRRGHFAFRSAILWRTIHFFVGGLSWRCS